MTKLIITPEMKPLKDRMKTQLRIALDLTEDGDVARVANLLGKIGRIEDEFWAEERVLFGFRQKAQVHANAEVFEPLIDEARVARFVATHVAEEFPHLGIFYPTLDFCVKHTAREFGGD